MARPCAVIGTGQTDYRKKLDLTLDGLVRWAAIEALEEASVAGDVGVQPIGRYHYVKEKKNRGIDCGVDVYPLQVRHQLLTWPEKGKREMAWLPIAEAALRVGEPELRRILLAFRKSMME